MSRENKVYKQFWIHKGDSNFCSELRYNIDTEKDEKVKPDDFYDIVSTNDTIEGGLHVVEYSALESANAEIAELKSYTKEELEYANLIVENKKLVDEIARLRDVLKQALRISQFSNDFVISRFIDKALNPTKPGEGGQG